MPRGNRREAPEIVSLATARLRIFLNEDQWFCETDKAYEIWQNIDGLPHMIKRIPANRVWGVMTTEKSE